jgi:transposase
MEWSGGAPAPPASDAETGRLSNGASPCPTNQPRPLPRWASISARIRSTLSASMDEGAIVLRQKWSRGQIEARLAAMPPCLIGMEACVGAHHLSRKLQGLGHDARLMPAKYVRAYSKGQKNDFRDAEAIAEAVQRPTMKFVATKTADQLDLQALHRVRERLVRQRTRIINQIRASRWNVGLRFARGPTACAPNCRASLPGALTCYRRARCT